MGRASVAAPYLDRWLIDGCQQRRVSCAAPDIIVVDNLIIQYAPQIVETENVPVMLHHGAIECGYQAIDRLCLLFCPDDETDE